MCNSTGSDNIFIGRCAGMQNGTGGCFAWDAASNIFIGGLAGLCNTIASNNTFLGYSAGKENTTGCNNVFVGQGAGSCNITGSCNVFVGTYAGSCVVGGNITGDNNIAIGYGAGTFDSPYNFGATGGNNIIVIGNNSHTASYVKVDWTTGSDARDKTNIIPIPVGKDFLKALNPIQYQWKDRETGEITAERPNYGFLAQDILELEDYVPSVIVDDHDPDHLKLRQSMIVPVLVKTVQELIEEVDALKEEVRILKGE